MRIAFAQSDYQHFLRRFYIAFTSDPLHATHDPFKNGDMYVCSCSESLVLHYISCSRSVVSSAK